MISLKTYKLGVGWQSSEIYWSCLGIGETPLKTVRKLEQQLSN